MPKRTHGMYRSTEHAIWRGILQRCTNDNNAAFASYGGRGIEICPRWVTSFEAFYEDMGPRPSLDHSVERRDNDQGYNPDNCYWATRTEQSNNRKNNVKVEVHGVEMSASQAARLTGLNATTLRKRIRAGVDSSVLLKPQRTDGQNETSFFDFEGKSLTAAGWAAEKGMSARTVADRVFKQGLTIEEALTKPLKETFYHNGRDLTITEWSRFSGISTSTLYNRIKIQKLSMEEALGLSERK